MGHPDGRRTHPRARTRTHARAHTHTRTHAHRRAHATAHTHTHTPQHASANARTHTRTQANAPRTRARTSARTRTRAGTKEDPPRQSAATACVFLDGPESPQSRKTRTVRARPAPQPGGAKRVGRSGAPTSTASPRQRRPRGSNRHPTGEHDEGPDSSATQSCQTGLWPMTGLRSEGGAHHGPLSAATSAQPLGVTKHAFMWVSPSTRLFVGVTKQSCKCRRGCHQARVCVGSPTSQYHGACSTAPYYAPGKSISHPAVGDRAGKCQVNDPAAPIQIASHGKWYTA